MMRSRLHRPWQPRMRDSHEFNPFVRTTQPEASFNEHEDLEEAEELTQSEAERLHAEAQLAAQTPMAEREVTK